MTCRSHCAGRRGRSTATTRNGSGGDPSGVPESARPTPHRAPTLELGHSRIDDGAGANVPGRSSHPDAEAPACREDRVGHVVADQRRSIAPRPARVVTGNEADEAPKQLSEWGDGFAVRR